MGSNQEAALGDHSSPLQELRRFAPGTEAVQLDFVTIPKRATDVQSATRSEHCACNFVPCRKLHRYTLASDGAYRHTLLRSASFQRLGGFSNQAEDRGTWRIETAADHAVVLALDSQRGGYRKLALAAAADGGVLLDRVRLAER
ncbi:MAG: hypothetical protein IT162_03090 [Bryobacterales bacterium]|nr:hypothetical protein [Bryobacterales bacterium]